MGKNASLEVKKFSVAFSILTLIPTVIALFFILMALVKFGFTELNRALLVFLGAMVMIYFLLPRISLRVENAIAPKKSNLKSNSVEKKV